MIDLILLGVKEIFQPYPLILLFLGTVAGIVVGCIPGFTITMGAALALPLTFGMTSIQGLSVMLGVLVGGLAGGQISGILLGIPGTPSSVATVFDGHPMAKRGEPGTALCLGIWASFFGGLISALILMFFTPPLADIALKFGPWEFFSLVAFGLTIIASLSGKSLLKGIIAGLLGLVSTLFGTDPMTGVLRFDFGLHGLSGGFSFLPVLIGLFAFSQLMSNLERKEGAGATLIENPNLIMMGALILHGIQPGPLLIVEFPDLVYGVFVAFFLAHFFMLGIQLYGIRLFVRLTRVPLYVLVPAILVFCSVGSYSIHNRFFDIWVLFIFGVLGYLMKKYEFPLAPVILGVILGPIAETNFRRALMTSSDYSLFFTRPISLFFLILCFLSLLYPFYQRYREKKRSSSPAEA
jgi:TctA family transporter